MLFNLIEVTMEIIIVAVTYTLKAEELDKRNLL